MHTFAEDKSTRAGDEGATAVATTLNGQLASERDDGKSELMKKRGIWARLMYNSLPHCKQRRRHHQLGAAVWFVGHVAFLPLRAPRPAPELQLACIRVPRRVSTHYQNALLGAHKRGLSTARHLQRSTRHSPSSNRRVCSEPARPSPARCSQLRIIRGPWGEGNVRLVIVPFNTTFVGEWRK